MSETNSHRYCEAVYAAHTCGEVDSLEERIESLMVERDALKHDYDKEHETLRRVERAVKEWGGHIVPKAVLLRALKRDA